MIRQRHDSLTDLARHGYWLRITCACGHDARLDPMKLLEPLMRLHRSTKLDRLSQSLKCQKCGGKDFEVLPCNGPEIWSR